MTDLIFLGTTHFTNREDIFTNKMQKEIDDFVTHIATLCPTKIAVELPRRYQSQLESLYQTFDASALCTKTPMATFEIYHNISEFSSDNEIFQLGFRLVKKLGHATLYAVDEDIEMSDDLFAKIQPHFSPDEYLHRLHTLVNSADTLEKQYRVLNSPECILADHNMYLAMNKVNSENHEGTQLLLQWYERNLKIYSNLQNLAKDGDRILLIIGSSHLELLQELAAADETMNVVDWL